VREHPPRRPARRLRGRRRAEHPATPGRSPDTAGIEGLRTAFHGFRTVFPDLHITIEDLVAAGDRVAGTVLTQIQSRRLKTA
jgi:predicted ester cyclase